MTALGDGREMRSLIRQAREKGLPMLAAAFEAKLSAAGLPLEEVPVLMPCGHPPSAVTTADGGTAYCVSCEEEAHLKRQAYLSQAQDVAQSRLDAAIDAGRALAATAQAHRQARCGECGHPAGKHASDGTCGAWEGRGAEKAPCGCLEYVPHRRKNTGQGDVGDGAMADEASASPASPTRPVTKTAGSKPVGDDVLPTAPASQSTPSTPVSASSTPVTRTTHTLENPAPPSAVAALHGSPEWLAERRGYLGASEVADAIGVGHGSPLFVYGLKTGEIAKVEPTPAMRHGVLLEPIVAEEFIRATSHILVKGRTFTHATLPLRAHLDYEVMGPDPDEPGPVGNSWVRIGNCQCKATSEYAEGWGDPGTDEIPERYLIQVTVEMGLSGHRVTWVPRFMQGKELEVFVVHFDADLYAWIEGRVQEFWSLVVARTPPPVDGSEGARAYLRERYAKANGVLIPATFEANDAADHYREASEIIKEAEAAKELASQRLKSITGDALGIQGDGWKFTLAERAEVVVKEHVKKAYRHPDLRWKKEKKS